METAESLNPVDATVDLQALATPEKPKEYTRKELGQLRRAHLTYVKPTVTLCGHSFSQREAPRNHCQSCWRAYFLTVAPLEEMHTVLRTAGIRVFKARYGDRVTKNFGLFLDSEVNKESETLGISEEGKGSESPESIDISAGVIGGQDEKPICIGRDAGQEVRLNGNINAIGQESGEGNPQHQNEPAHAG